MSFEATTQIVTEQFRSFFCEQIINRTPYNVRDMIIAEIESAFAEKVLPYFKSDEIEAFSVTTVTDPKFSGRVFSYNFDALLGGVIKRMPAETQEAVIIEIENAFRQSVNQFVNPEEMKSYGMKTFTYYEQFAAE